MPFSIIKALKSTHRHPINRTLHFLGAPIYVTGIAMIIGSIWFGTNLVNGVILWSMAIGLFLLGHKIEGNLKAITLVVLFKYLIRSVKLMATTTHTS